MFLHNDKYTVPWHGKNTVARAFKLEDNIDSATDSIKIQMEKIGKMQLHTVAYILTHKQNYIHMHLGT